jgi:hypothetical protein
VTPHHGPAVDFVRCRKITTTENQNADRQS